MKFSLNLQYIYIYIEKKEHEKCDDYNTMIFVCSVKTINNKKVIRTFVLRLLCTVIFKWFVICETLVLLKCIK